MKHEVIIVTLLAGLAACSGCSQKSSTAAARESEAGLSSASAAPAPTTPGVPATNPMASGQQRAPGNVPAATGSHPTEAPPDGGSLPAYAHSGALAQDLRAVRAAAARTGAAAFDTTTVGDLALVAPPGKSIVEGKLPPASPDPEREYIREHGRRDAPLTRTPLTGGKDSADDLARALLATLTENDYMGMHLLRITEAEFEDIFWPEFPQSAPFTNNAAPDAWFFQVNEMNDGVKALMDAEGGKALVFDRLDCVAGRLRYRNFNLYTGMIIVAHRPDGTEVRLRHAWSFCERLGTWKVYMYDDQSHGEYLAEYPPTE